MTFIRQPWTGLTSPLQARWLGDLPGEATPTTVNLADGSTYTIPSGPPGSFPWAREASLIAVAYADAGDDASSRIWQQEFSRRLAAYNAIQAGQDASAVVNAGSWIDGPAAIFGFAGKTISDLENRADQLVGSATGLVNWVPIVAVGILAVIAFGFNKKSLSVRV